MSVSCFFKCSFSGSASERSVSAFVILSRICAAAAFVNVTTSSLSISVSCAGSHTSSTMRWTSTAVLPDQIEWLRSARAESVLCPFRGRIRYEPGEVSCGLIQVPENREVPGSRTIELHYVRIAATGKDVDGKAVEKRADPVIYLTGGPGVGVEYYVGKLTKHRIIEQRDLYILEQRGIGNIIGPS